MRYSSAVVLSTLAVGGAAAAHSHRHASFHARRQADAKRSPDSGVVNWDAIAYDLKGVDWSSINWSSVFASTPAATPVAVPTSSAEPKKVVATPVAEVKQPSPSPVAPSSQAAQTSQAAPAQHSPSSGKGGNIVSDLMVGVASIANKLGAKIGKNDQSPNGGIWIGTDSAWQMEVTNSGNSESVFYCWKSSGFSGMSINVNIPDVSVGLKPGEKVNLSFAANVPAACAPASASSALAMFGGIDETWAEVTFGQWGAFDVSRNVNMKGSSISMVGTQCTSNMDTCVFMCKNPNAKSCETGYELYNCNASNGGGGGYDPIMDGTGGGCSMPSNGETIKVSFS